MRIYADICNSDLCTISERWIYFISCVKACVYAEGRGLISQWQSSIHDARSAELQKVGKGQRKSRWKLDCQSREPGFESSHCYFEVCTFSSSPRCLSPPSCLNEYQGIDIDVNVWIIFARDCFFSFFAYHCLMARSCCVARTLYHQR